MFISSCGLRNYPTLFVFASIWNTEKIVLQAEIRIFYVVLKMMNTVLLVFERIFTAMKTVTQIPLLFL